MRAVSLNPDALVLTSRLWQLNAVALRSGGEASPEYRAHLVTVMAKRAVQACG